MRLDRREQEWSCLTCGHVDYGEGFTVLDKVNDQPGLARGARHMGSRL